MEFGRLGIFSDSYNRIGRFQPT